MAPGTSAPIVGGWRRALLARRRRNGTRPAAAPTGAPARTRAWQRDAAPTQRGQPRRGADGRAAEGPADGAEDARRDRAGGARAGREGHDALARGLARHAPGPRT